MQVTNLQLPLDRQFVEQARLTPDKVALMESNRSVTYAELESLTSRGGAALRALGIVEGSIVGLHVDRSIAWVTGVLAILRAGAGVMPLPPNYPLARLREILVHAGLHAVIHNQTTPLDLAASQLSLDLDELCSETSLSAITPDSDGQWNTDQPAFVLCSSGSTGVPKMIVRSHRSFFHRLNWTWTRHPFVAGEVGCHKAHTTTTHGIYELFEPLLRGIPTVIVRDHEVRDLEQFWWRVRSHGITRLLIVPSAMQASLDIPGFVPPSLQVLVLMGEHLQSGLARRIVGAFPEPTGLYSVYGSTEASSTLVCDLREFAQPGRELPLGRPITSDVGVHVLDGNLDPVTPGDAGRLFISGPALFTGYFKDPDLTSAVTIHHPRNGERLYDTRDQVRRMPDGNLIFVGRVDDTVKIRGFRIELAEVERAMHAHPDITQTAVIATGGDTAEAALIGFFTPRSVDVTDVYRVLRDRLPSYMVPSTLVGLDAFPLTERSKLDRKRLLAEHLLRLRDRFESHTLSDLEKRVAAVWERTLGHRRFDLDSSFFEVGGTSLTASVLMHRLRTEFSLDRERLPEQFAYRFPTVEVMARHFGEADNQGPAVFRARSSIVVTLRRATDTSKPPLFFVSSAGGTLGAYQKVAAALNFGGEILGIRDPFVSGEREPTEDFKTWVAHYIEAIKSHCPQGPYHIAAYSSAGAFGYEMARELRQHGAEVRLLALIDPLGIEGNTWRHFGWWVWRGTHSRPWVRELIRFAARLRRPSAQLLRWLARKRVTSGFSLSEEEFAQTRNSAIQARGYLRALAGLLELNTGLPIDFSNNQVPEHPGESMLGALQDRVAQFMPELDAQTIERIVVQYSLQVLAQRAYLLTPYDAPVLLVEPSSPYEGLIEDQIRPYLSQLRAVRLELGAANARVSAISKRFGPLAPHYLCMRNDKFVSSLARELDQALETAPSAEPNSGSI